METLVVHGWITKLRAKAAALYFVKNKDRIERIIFSGGKTAGKEKPSEAADMKAVFLRRVQLLLEDWFNKEELEKKISLEEDSCDTEENAERVGHIESVGKDTSLRLLSSASHLPRIWSIYKRLGFQNISTISAEWIFWDTHKRRYQDYIKKYLPSKPVLRAGLFEVPLFFLTQFKKGREFIRSKTEGRIRK